MAFSQTLAGFDAFDSIWASNGFQRTPMRCNVVGVTLAATGATPAEGKPKLISRFSLSTGTLEPAKSTCIIVITSEVAKLTSEAAQIWLIDKLRAGIAKETDRVFVNAIIDNGSVDSVASSGSTLDAFNNALSTAMPLLNLGANSRPYWIMPPRVTKVASLMRGSGGSPAYPQLEALGGSIGGVPVLPSDELTDTIIARSTHRNLLLISDRSCQIKRRKRACN
jgi:hypothetical protein